MTDTWRVERETGQAFNDVTGQYEPTFATVYEGPGKWQTFEAYEQSPAAAGHTFVVTRSHLHLPFTDESAGVRPDDIAECMTSRMDPDNVGARLRIAAESSKTYRTARRFPVSEVQA